MCLSRVWLDRLRTYHCPVTTSTRISSEPPHTGHIHAATPMAEEEAASTSPGKDELRRLIVAAGEELRAARAGGDSGAGADVLARLLDLKQRYEALTGEEFRTKSVKRSRKEAAASGAI